jgi:hypothetical protein
MIARCENPRNVGYHNYGGRGIKVCQRWRQSFVVFMQDMGPRPDGLTIERVDTNGNYEPSNCKWATPKEQANNFRHNVRLAAFGANLTLTEWAERIGIQPSTLRHRIFKLRWSVEDALTTPLHTEKSHPRAVA